MPSYRPPISRNQYHDLEIYYHKLVMFIQSWDFRDMKSEQQARIYRELTYMEITIDVLGTLFTKPDGIEKPVLAWLVDGDPLEPDIVHRFSCVKVAAGATGCNQSKVSAVCKGKRPNTGSESRRDVKTGKIVSFNKYKFVYEEDYDENLMTITPGTTKNKTDEQNITETNGDL